MVRPDHRAPWIEGVVAIKPRELVSCAGVSKPKLGSMSKIVGQRMYIVWKGLGSSTYQSEWRDCLNVHRYSQRKCIRQAIASTSFAFSTRALNSAVWSSMKYFPAGQSSFHALCDSLKPTRGSAFSHSPL